MADRPPFDPYAILAALERRRVSFIVVGAFARVQGAEEVTHGIDVVPAIRGENVRRLEFALDDLDAFRVDGEPVVLDEPTIRDEPPLELRSPAGELKVVPEPAGTHGGYDDLRRAATREPIGKGLRPSVASTADLARISGAKSTCRSSSPSASSRRSSERSVPSSDSDPTKRRRSGHVVPSLFSGIARETQIHHLMRGSQP